MKKHIIIVVPFLIILLLAGCTRYHAENVVATIDNQPLSVRDYESTFERLSGGRERGLTSSLEEREEFLDLLVKFKLKIKDAYDSGLHQEPEIQAELDDYQKALAAAYLVERELVEPSLREMYKRRTEEVRASHILLRTPPNATPDDTLHAYRTAKDIIEKLERGESFAELAVRYSEDPGVQNNKGDLNYFTGGVMVKPFEDAVYSLDIGEFTSEPARSQFGYHIIKLYDRRTAPGNIRVSHIMTFAQPGMSPQDTLNAYNKIQQALDTLKAGANFQEIAWEFSEDRQSAERGGDLGVIRRRSLPPDFENVAFSLQPGKLSDVVRTEYGFHIIKVTESQPVQTYDQMKDELRRTYQQRYMQDDHKQFIAQLKNKYSLQRYSDNVERFIEAVDTQWFAETQAWHDSLDASLLVEPLFAIDGNEIPVEQFARQIQTNPEFIGRQLRPNRLRDMLQRVEEIELINREAENIEVRYPDFAAKIDEYRDGILIYYIEQKRVWDQIDLSEELLLAYYEKNKENYTFPDRVNICEIVVRNDSLAQELYEKVIAGEDMEELAAEYTLRSGMKRQRGVTGMIDADRDALAKQGFVQEVGEVSEPFKFGNNYAIVKTIERDPARIRTFEEARAQVTGEYQDMMSKKIEREWVESLKERYRVSLYPENLEKVFLSEDQ